MPKRTISCSFEETILAGCVHFLESNEVDITQAKLSEVVELSLESFHVFLAEEGLVPREGIPNPGRYLDTRFASAPSPSSGGMQAAIRKLLENRASTSKEEISRLVKEATDYEVPAKEPELYEVEDPPPEPIDLENPPWLGVDTILFGIIRETAPKDVLVEKLLQEPDPVLQKAVEVVYAVYPQVHWGTEKCTKLVAGTYEKFKPYAELLDTT